MMLESMRNLLNGRTLGLSDLDKSDIYPNPYEIYVQGFWRCDEAVVQAAEQSLQGRFPSELREYYCTLGVGQFVPKGREAALSENNVLIPTHIPRLVQGTCQWAAPYTRIQPDTIPFFERGVDLFLCVRPRDTNPNAVYWMWGNKICDSLVEFFERLVVDPDWFNPPK